MLPRGLTRVSLPARRHRERRSSHPLRAFIDRESRRALKRAMLRDCGRRCVYCGVFLAPDETTIDHVHPLARGGSHLAGNLVTACGHCNRMKGDMLPFEFFARHPWAGINFVRYARVAHRGLKRGARRAVSLALAA